MKKNIFYSPIYNQSSSDKIEPKRNTFKEKIRANASTFHKNFSSGEFDKNGPLVNEKIYVNSNNAIVIGRTNFVERIKRFHTPFPSLNLKDKIIIVDKDEVALLYIMQGKHDGPYGSIPASGNKINVYAVEFFSMDDKALMKELLTITQLDRLVKQIIGEEIIEQFEKVNLLSIDSTLPKSELNNKKKLEQYIQHINTRDWQSFDNLFSSSISTDFNGRKIKGTKLLIKELQNFISTVPNATYHLIRNIVEGNRGAIAYEIHGTCNDCPQNSEEKKATRKLEDVKQAAHFEFNKEGLITKIILVFNSDDL